MKKNVRIIEDNLNFGTSEKVQNFLNDNEDSINQIFESGVFDYGFSAEELVGILATPFIYRAAQADAERNLVALQSLQMVQQVVNRPIVSLADYKKAKGLK